MPLLSAQLPQRQTTVIVTIYVTGVGSQSSFCKPMYLIASGRSCEHDEGNAQDHFQHGLLTDVDTAKETSKK